MTTEVVSTATEISALQDQLDRIVAEWQIDEHTGEINRAVDALRTGAQRVLDRLYEAVS